MTDLEIDQLKQELRQTQALLKQEEGKRIAIERDCYETKRQAKLVEEQAAALRAETDKSLLEAADQMKIALSVSQGIFALGQMCHAFMARKVAAARVVHRETQLCLLMQQMIDGFTKNDQLSTKTAMDKMLAVITTIKGDGEASRLAAAETMLAYGIKNFETVFDQLVADGNNEYQTRTQK